MEGLRQLLPSANTLIVFEAAGRLRNFTTAARELGVSQAAVSYAIKTLEDHLGVILFRREYRRVALTDAGAAFFEDVSFGLSHIRKSAERLRVTNEAHVTLSASTAFASLWVVPRLQRFREEVPGIELRIQTGDRDLDLFKENIPLSIRRGDASEWPGYDLEPIGVEEVYPVCSPRYCERFGMPRDIADLLLHRLIHLEDLHRSAVTWPEWFESAGIDGGLTPNGLLINDYVSVIQSVMQGEGIALGWHHLVDHLVEDGTLIRLTKHVHNTGKFFNVAWRKDRMLSRSSRIVKDWLCRQ